MVSNSKKLTCNLVYNSIASNYSFLRFNETTGVFEVKLNIAKSLLPSPLSGLTSVQMSTVKLGENCDLLSYLTEVYSIGSNLVKISSTLSVQASSSNLYYIVANNSLYRYSAASLSYTILLSLGTMTKYGMQSYENQVVVWGAVNQISGVQYNVNQTIYHIVVENNIASSFSQTNIISYENDGMIVPVKLSPTLSKVHIEYISSPGNATKTIRF